MSSRLLQVLLFLALAVLAGSVSSEPGQTGPDVEVAGELVSLTPEEKEWIRENPVIRVANEIDWPPFDYAVGGEPLGYSIDTIKLVAGKTGLGVKFVNGYNWSELLEKLREGELDVMPAVYADDERRQYMAFTGNYYSQPSVIVIRRNDDSITDFSSLEGKTVAGVQGFVITRELQTGHPGKHVLEVESVLDGITAVSLGKADAYIDSIGLVSYVLENNFIPNLKILGAGEMGAITNPSLRMGVRKQDQVLLGIIQKGLSAISREEKNLLARKWLEFTPYEKQMVFTREQIDWVRQHPVVTVGVDKSYAPYSFLNEDGEYIGIAPDFLKLVSEKLGMRFVVVPGLEWPEILDGVRQRKLDVVATAVKTEERSEYLDFTPIYIPTPLVIMVQENEQEIKNRKHLAGRRLALVKAYSSSKRVLAELGGVDPVWVETPLEGLQAVAASEVDAYIGVIGVNYHLSREHGITNLKVAGSFDLNNNGQRIAVRSDWPELTVMISQALDSITEEERAAIFDRWIRVPYVSSTDYSLLWKMLLVFIAVTGFLYLYNRRLSREVVRRTEAEKVLRETNENLALETRRADEASLAKSRFISNMNHELRTPLTAIIGFSELLQSAGKLNEEQQAQIQHIRNAGSHLLELINDIIYMSALEVGGLDLAQEPLDPGEIVGESLVLVSPLAQEHGIGLVNSVTKGSGKVVFADATRLKQVLINLLSNAIKYNRENGRVEVSSKAQGDSLVIEVLDTGPGLTAEQIDRLFVEFERVGAEKTEIQGTGIGLALSKKLMEAMGGDMGVSSAPGEGSVFWISIPAHPVGDHS